MSERFLTAREYQSLVMRVECDCGCGEMKDRLLYQHSQMFGMEKDVFAATHRLAKPLFDYRGVDNE